MSNYLSFPMLMLCMTVFLTVSAQVPKIHYDREIGRPEVKATGTLEKISTPGAVNNANTPPGMLAYTVAENDCLINWVPSQDTGRITGQADIIDALVSSDESLLIVAERVGGANQNNSTRLIFINLLNNKICGSMDIPERRIVKLLDCPGQNGKFLAFQKGQSAFQNGDALLMIDVKKRRIRQIGKDITEEIADLCTDGERVWFAIAKTNRICEIDLERPAKVRYCDTKKAVLKLGYNPASQSVIAVENGICEFFTVTINGLFLDNSIELPGKCTPAWMMPIPNRASSVIIIDTNNDGYLLSSGGLIPLNGRFAPHGCALQDGTVLLGTLDRSPRLNKLALPGGEVKGYIVPSTLRPLNRNKTFAVFARSGNASECIQLDEQGNVFKLTVTGRRGRKNTILIVNKTGLR